MNAKENDALITDNDKKMLIGLSILIFLFELIYVNGQKFAMIAIPTLSIYIWINTNLIIIATLIYSQVFKEYFRLGIFLPYVFYFCAFYSILIVRLESDNFFNNFDVLLLLTCFSYAAFFAYSIPRCFMIDDNIIKYLIQNPSLSKRVVRVTSNSYGEDETVEMNNL
jgi:hypothetical protein